MEKKTPTCAVLKRAPWQPERTHTKGYMNWDDEDVTPLDAEFVTHAELFKREMAETRNIGAPIDLTKWRK